VPASLDDLAQARMYTFYGIGNWHDMK
jgi:hypothetical protein